MTHSCITRLPTQTCEAKKIALNNGEEKNVSFELTPEHLSLLDRNMKRVVELGVFEVMVGHSPKDIRLKGSFTVIG